MTKTTPPQMLGRAVAAVALTVGFYALALAIAAAMIGGPIAAWAINGRFNVFVTIGLFAAGFTILRAMVPARDRFVAPGPKMTKTGHPELYGELEAVAGS